MQAYLTQDEIQKITKIQLKYHDFIGNGLFGDVYHYQINNNQLAIKCFENKSKAKEENNLIQKIQSDTCPKIIQYYGMQKLNIEIVGALNRNYEGYALFFQASSADISKTLNKDQIEEVLNFLSQMSLSLLCLHLKQFKHKNIQPESILVNEFQNQNGFSLYLINYEETVIEELLSKKIKALSFILKSHQNPQSAEIYALGIVILQLLVGQQTVLKLNTALNAQQYAKELENIQNILKQCPEFVYNIKNELLDMLLNMVNFQVEKRPKIIEICQILANQNYFSMNVLQNYNFQALIILLKNSFNIPQNLGESQLPSFHSDIIKNPYYSSIILMLLDKQGIQLSRIHGQFNLKPKTFNSKTFHKDCNNKGSTLVIMHSKKEPNSFFGGFAVPQ